MTKVGVADGFLHIKELEDVAFSLSKSKIRRLLKLEQIFDRKPKEQIIDEKFLAREQNKQIVEDRAQIKQIVDFDGKRIWRTEPGADFVFCRVLGREFDDRSREQYYPEGISQDLPSGNPCCIW